MYMLKISDNNNTSVYDFDTKAEAMKKRTALIQAYGYKKSAGWTRHNAENIVSFHHAIYSTVVFYIYRYFI